MSSTAWERCPNCCRNTKQRVDTGYNQLHPFVVPVKGKPYFQCSFWKTCLHCNTTYQSIYSLVFTKHIITKKGKEGYLVPSSGA